MKLDVMMIFDVVMIVLGIYMVISAQKMKKTNETGTVILTEEEAVSCRDKKGFVAYIYPRETVMGIVFMVCGTIRLLDSIILKIGGALNVIPVILLLLVLAWFYKGLMTARAQFL